MTAAVKMFRLDLLTMQVYLKSYMIFMVYPLLFAWWEPVGMGVMAGFMLAMLGGSIFSVQEKNKLERLYGMLSISDSSLVAGRYLFLLVNCLMVQMAILPLHILASRLIGRMPGGEDLLLAMGLSYFLFWLQSSYQVPLFLKFGYTKMRLWVTLPFVLVALAFGFLTPMFKEAAPSIETWFEQIHQHSLSLSLILLALGTLLGMISYLISIGVYKSTKQ